MNDKDHERTSEPRPEPIIREEDLEKFSAPTSHHTEILLDPTLNPITVREQSGEKPSDAGSGSGGNSPGASENNESGKS